MAAKVLTGTPGGGPHPRPDAAFWPVYDAHVARGPHGAWIEEVLAARTDLTRPSVAPGS